MVSTESGEIDLAPAAIVADLPRLLEAHEVGQRIEATVLIGRRQLRSANSWTHNVEVLDERKGTLHPRDPSRRRLPFGLANGEMAFVTSDVGKVELPVEITDSIRPGVVSIPYGWGHGQPGSAMKVAANYAGANVNLLSNGSIDELSGNAVLNGIPVTVAHRAGDRPDST